MAKSVLYKIKKTYLKLLKAWTKGNTEKAIRLQHKLIELEFEYKREK